MKQLFTQFARVKAASRTLLTVKESVITTVLSSLATNLENQWELIQKENAKDLLLMSKEDPRYDRLLLNKERILAMAKDVRTVASLPSPHNQILQETVRPNGLTIQKISIPFGVIAVIFESRPNVVVDVFSLCFKSRNACILKGGKEAAHSNACLVKLIAKILKDNQLDAHLIYLLPLERSATTSLLQARGYVDVCIPRGSQVLIDYVRTEAQIPVIETGAGIVHAYFDEAGDVEKGRAIIENAKTRRVSVCNALDCLLIHISRLQALPKLLKPLAAKQVEVFADEESFAHLKGVYPASLLHKAQSKDYGVEFLSLKLAIRAVPTIQDALEHIRQYSSGHSETIISEDKAAISYFMTQVDAAAVYANASSAFTDGAQFGLGAEIGISTQKLHARGPMGLEALTSYKWIIFGDGHIRD